MGEGGGDQELDDLFRVYQRLKDNQRNKLLSDALGSARSLSTHQFSQSGFDPRGHVFVNNLFSSGFVQKGGCLFQLFFIKRGFYLFDRRLYLRLNGSISYVRRLALSQPFLCRFMSGQI